MLDRTLTLPEDPEELRGFTARLVAEVKAQAILIESESGPAQQDRAVRWTNRSDQRPERKRRAGASRSGIGRTGLAARPRLRDSSSWRWRPAEITAAAMTAWMKLPDIDAKDKPKRSPIPDHIRQIEAELTPGADACADCGSRLRRIGKAEEDQEAIRWIVSPTMGRGVGIRPRGASS